MSILLFSLAGFAVLAAAVLGWQGVAIWDDSSGMGPIVTVFYLSLAVVLVMLAGAVIALGLAARFHGQRRNPMRSSAMAPGPPPDRAGKDNRAGLWLMWGAPLVALGGLALSVARTLPWATRSDWESAFTLFAVLVGALNPIIVAAVMLAVGAWLRRNARAAPKR
ncbi:hypothetical protein [Sinisalibacter aestuarii]|nr:hypothetical protein [Sinisalibacter aestuarii]